MTKNREDDSRHMARGKSFDLKNLDSSSDCGAKVQQHQLQRSLDQKETGRDREGNKNGKFIKDSIQRKFCGGFFFSISAHSKIHLRMSRCRG